MDKLKAYNLGFFLTEKSSLGTWEQAGILSREIAPYNILADYFNKIYLFSYGEQSDQAYQNRLAPNIQIVFKDALTTPAKYNWILPFRHWNKVKQCHFLKTNQLKSRAALLVKILHPWSKLILRTGYTASLFQKQQHQLISWKLRWWEKIAYHLCDLALVSSVGDRHYLMETYQIKPEKIKIIPNYIDTTLFRPDQQPKLENKIIYVGRLHQQKNLSALIEALQGGSLALDVVGENTADQAQKKSLIAQAQSQKVPLNFLGKVANEQLPNILNRYAIFVLPSLYEGLPKALLEAMSCGLACVATNVSGSREVITDQQTGLLAQTTPASLKENILKLMSNPELRKTLGQQARESILKNFSLHSQIQKEIAIYEQHI